MDKIEECQNCGCALDMTDGNFLHCPKCGTTQYKKKTNRSEVVLVCKYSPICDANCEKCKWLKELQIVPLDELETLPAFSQNGV